MNATEAPKNILESLLRPSGTSGQLSVALLVTSLLISALAGLYICYIYKRTFIGVLYSRSFNTTLMFQTLASTLIIQTIYVNPVLSLGIIGAVSIVRFRSAVKDSMDIVFLFWATAAGITIGAGVNYFIFGLVGTAVVGILLYLLVFLKERDKYPYLLIVRHNAECAGKVAFELRKLPRNSHLKSKTATPNGMEVIFNLSLSGDGDRITRDLRKIDGVFDATLVRMQQDYKLQE